MAVKKLPPGWCAGEYEYRDNALGVLPDRVQTLYGCECVWKVLPVCEVVRPEDLRPRQAIEAGVTWVLNPTEENERAASQDAALDAFRAYAEFSTSLSTLRCALVAYAAYASASASASASAVWVSGAVDWSARAAVEASIDLWPWFYQRYVEARGPEGLAFSLEWRTSDAVGLARGIFHERDWSAMPILADALADAGCDHPDLNRLQTNNEFTRADYWITNLMGIWE